MCKLPVSLEEYLEEALKQTFNEYQKLVGQQTLSEPIEVGYLKFAEPWLELR